MGRALLVMEGKMICRYRDLDGKCLNVEENIMCKKYPSERYCQIMCNFRETDEEGAREWVLGCIHHDGFVETKRGDVANQVIKEALEKQIPKKPSQKEIDTMTVDGDIVRVICRVCPCCGEIISIENYIISSCKCGQSLDWSEEE